MRKLMSPRVTPWINYTANIYQSDPKVQTIFTISCWLFNDKGWDELEYVIASNSTTYSELLIKNMCWKISSKDNAVDLWADVEWWKFSRESTHQFQESPIQ